MEMLWVPLQYKTLGSLPSSLYQERIFRADTKNTGIWSPLDRDSKLKENLHNNIILLTTKNKIQ